jgi:tripartite-type tricarboxylate transporter receptor subunit TctC
MGHVTVDAAQSARGQDYPKRPIRYLVGGSAGGGANILARAIGQKRTELAAKSVPDGYTIMIGSASHAINPSLYRKVNYDPLRDFSAITLAISFPFVLAVHPSVPVQSVKDCGLTS